MFSKIVILYWKPIKKKITPFTYKTRSFSITPNTHHSLTIFKHNVKTNFCSIIMLVCGIACSAAYLHIFSIIHTIYLQYWLVAAPPSIIKQNLPIVSKSVSQRVNHRAGKRYTNSCPTLTHTHCVYCRNQIERSTSESTTNTHTIVHIISLLCVCFHIFFRFLFKANRPLIGRCACVRRAQEIFYLIFCIQIE